MFEAHPTNWTTSAYDLKDGKRVIGQLTLNGRDEGVLTIGEVPFALGNHKNHFVLLFEGIEVARAVQPSIWKRQLTVQVEGTLLDRAYARPGAADITLDLFAKHAFSRAFHLEERGTHLGRIYPLGAFSRNVGVDLPDWLTPAVQGFLFALVAIQWARARRRS